MKFIKTTWDGKYQLINVNFIQSVITDRDGDTKIYFQDEKQNGPIYVDQSVEEVLELISNETVS